MAEIINLRRMRKLAERAKKDERAVENRFAYGRTKAERKLGEAQQKQAERNLDAHRIAPEPDE